MTRSVFRAVSLRAIAAGLLGVSLTGCATMNQTEKGALIGASAGAAIGAVVGKKTGNTAAGTIVGATVGGAAGAIIGRQMDEQAAALEKGMEDAKIERVGDEIKVTFASGILFDFNASTLRPEARANLNTLAQSLQKYPGHNVIIRAHTDSKGDDAYNLRLSEQRASSTAHYLISLGVSPSRITTQGLGESQPVDTNDTELGRQNNRRAEIQIYATEEYRQQLETQASK